MAPPQDLEASRTEELSSKEPKWWIHCCGRCVEVLSGATLLLLVAFVVTLIRFFLEFPTILEGFEVLPHTNATSLRSRV